MKTKLKYCFLIGSMVYVVLFSACLDVLDKSPDGNTTMEEVLADPNKVESLLNTCYHSIPLKAYMYYMYDAAVVLATDDGYSSAGDGISGFIANGLYNDLSTASMHYLDNIIYDLGIAAPGATDGKSTATGGYWYLYWPQIRLCSQFIENIDRAAVRNESDRARFKAEAHVLRAFFYSELVKWYGKVPILDKTVPFDADFSEMFRSPVYDVAKFIVEDCDVAISTSELPWRITIDADALRVTKALAWALKAKMMLFAASPLHNENNNYWEEAYQVCKQAVSELRANGYELFTTCTNEALYGTLGGPYGAPAYYQLSCENSEYSASPRDRETIWRHKAGGNFTWHVGYIGSDMSGTYSPGVCPTQELVDAYETIDGVPVLNLSRPYLDENHLQPNYNPENTLYDSNDPYKNRDPRMDATIMHNGSTLIWDREEVTVETFEGGLHQPNFNPSEINRSRTGYFMRKMVVPTSCGTNALPGPHWKFYRFGELLLDFAEAACEANHLAEAKEAADEVRARVEMPPLPAGLSQDQLRLRIHNERRVELAWEEQRFYDLRRWQKPDGDLTATCKWPTAMLITKDPATGRLSYQRSNIRSTPRGGWQNRYLLLPIPLADCSRLEAVTGVKWQNPGW